MASARGWPGGRRAIRWAAASPAAEAAAPPPAGSLVAPRADLSPTPPSPLTQPGPPVREARKSRLWTWVAAGAAVAAVGVGTYYGLSSKSDADALHANVSPPRTNAANQSLADSAQSKATTANAFYAIAGGCAAAGITLFFVEGSF